MPDTPSEPQVQPPRRWVWIGLAIAILIAVTVLLFETEDTADLRQSDAPAPAPPVSVLMLSPENVTAEVSMFAELLPRWDVELRSAVSGRILVVHDGALAGAKVEAGDTLFSIEKTPYETAVAAAEMELEQAKLALLRAENNVSVARKQFERDGIEPPTELAIQLPQLRIAEKTVAAARSRLRAALRELSDTDVVAPFSGFVIQRFASLGQTVNQGERLVHLSDDRQFELVAELSQADWALLDHPIADQEVALSLRDGSPLGRAVIRHGGGFLDKETRQLQVYLDVIDPGESVLSGDFLRVTFTGRTVRGVLTVPERALTRAGHVWFVDGDNLLQRMTPDILFRADRYVAIATPDGTGPWQVVKTPLASFLPGQRVSPNAVED